MFVKSTVQRRPANIRLSGLGDLDSQDQMVRGANYVFNFTYGRLGIAVDPADVSKWVASDSNFKDALATVKSGWLSNIVQVSFVYNGRGSDVRSAGLEMQNVINSHLSLTKLYFDSATGGSGSVSPAANGASNPGSGSQLDIASLARLMNLNNFGSSNNTGVGWGTIVMVGGGVLLGTVALVKLAGGGRR